MILFLTGLVIFFATHVFTMLRGPRERLLARLGPLPYRGLYSLLALGGFVLMVMGYGDAPRVELWQPSSWLRHLTMLLMLPVFVLLLAAYLPGRIKARVGNPMLLAVKTWALAHLLANGDLPSVLLFGSFLAWAVVDLVAVKRSGRTPVVAAPRPLFDVIAVVGGLALYGAFVAGLHGVVTGMPLVAP